jgi:hypothetical protein
VIINEATLEESIKALLTTFAGSIIPSSIIFTYLSF